MTFVVGYLCRCGKWNISRWVRQVPRLGHVMLLVVPPRSQRCLKQIFQVAKSRFVFNRLTLVQLCSRRNVCFRSPRSPHTTSLSALLAHEEKLGDLLPIWSPQISRPATALTVKGSSTEFRQRDPTSDSHEITHLQVPCL